MVIEFAEILHDLELKRAAALPAAERPGDRRRRARSPTRPRRRTSGCATRTAARRRSTPRWPGALVADAISTLAVASGEADADTAAGRAIVRAATRPGRRAARRPGGDARSPTADLRRSSRRR